MVKLGVKSAFPPELIRHAVICQPGGQFEVATRARGVDSNEDTIRAVPGLEHEGEDGEQGIARVTGKRVRV